MNPGVDAERYHRASSGSAEVDDSLCKKNYIFRQEKTNVNDRKVAVIIIRECLLHCLEKITFKIPFNFKIVLSIAKY